MVGSPYMRRVAALLVVGAWLATGATPALAQSAADPRNSFEQLLAAVSRNAPPEEQAGYFTEDAIVSGGPCGDAPGGVCVGRAQLVQAFASSGSSRVSLLGMPTVSGEVGNVLQVRLAVGATDLAQAGIDRFVDIGQVVFTNGKISRMSLTWDVTDPQTLTFLRLMASMGPQNPAPGPVAQDGQRLADQPASTQIQFLTVWGDQAAAQWVKQHDAATAAGGR